MGTRTLQSLRAIHHPPKALPFPILVRPVTAIPTLTVVAMVTLMGRQKRQTMGLKEHRQMREAPVTLEPHRVTMDTRTPVDTVTRMQTERSVPAMARNKKLHQQRKQQQQQQFQQQQQHQRPQKLLVLALRDKDTTTHTRARRAMDTATPARERRAMGTATRESPQKTPMCMDKTVDTTAFGTTTTLILLWETSFSLKRMMRPAGKSAVTFLVNQFMKTLQKLKL